MMPSLQKSATLAQTDTWRKDSRLRLHHACISHLVEMINKFGSEGKYLLCADGQVQHAIYCAQSGIYCNILSYTVIRCVVTCVGTQKNLWMKKPKSIFCYELQQNFGTSF